MRPRAGKVCQLLGVFGFVFHVQVARAKRKEETSGVYCLIRRRFRFQGKCVRRDAEFATHLGRDSLAAAIAKGGDEQEDFGVQYGVRGSAFWCPSICEPRRQPAAPDGACIRAPFAMSPSMSPPM